MIINKMGFEHKEYGINCQDYAFEKNGTLCVLDGCSEGKHSEVGVKLFAQMLEVSEKQIDIESIDDIFRRLISLLGHSFSKCKDFLCFTILYVIEEIDRFTVYTCGDGYIIKQNRNDEIEFIRLDDGAYPKYYVYNFVDKKYLGAYKEGVAFNQFEFKKEEYKCIGVATDGLRYIFDKSFEGDFIEKLKNHKEVALKRLINKEFPHFKDDISIAF